MRIIGKAVNLFFKIVAIILILALILVVVSLFVTPSTFGLENTEINGVTIEEMGLADISFYDIGKIAIGILHVQSEDEPEDKNEGNYEDVDKDKIEADKDKPEADKDKVEDEKDQSATEKLPPASESTVPTEEKLADLTKEPIYFEEEVEVELDSTELTDIVNIAIGAKDFSEIDFGALFGGDLSDTNFANNESTDVKVSLSETEEYFEMSTEEIVVMLQDYDCEFVNIDVSTDGEFVYSTSKFKMTLPEEILEQVNSAMFFPISETLYMTFDSKYTLDDGALVPVPSNESSIKLNSMNEKMVITTATLAMSMIAGESVDGESVLVSYDNSFGTLLSKIINNLAYINSIDDGVINMTTRTK